MRLALPALALATLLSTTPAQAAQSYDNCTGYIDSVPAVISTQGTWCLRADLASSLGGGAMIDVVTNNVTIDCNHFKLGGLAAGVETSAVGIRALNRSAVTVRNCNIRGFNSGISLQGTGGGHLVEHNRLELNTYMGIRAESQQCVVRNNLVKDTGGSTGAGVFGIYVLEGGTVLDNVVDGVWAEGGNTDPIGIYGSVAVVMRRNIIREISSTDSGLSYGIVLISSDSLARDNDVIGVGPLIDIGIYCVFTASTARGNTIINAATGISNCTLDDNHINTN